VPRKKANELKPIRCSNCGHFLGLECIKTGVVKIKCKNCKGWTVIIGAEEDFSSIVKHYEGVLTSEGKSANIRQGTKGR
jgi:phage FluMu protein Com